MALLCKGLPPFLVGQSAMHAFLMEIWQNIIFWVFFEFYFQIMTKGQFKGKINLKLRDPFILSRKYENENF